VLAVVTTASENMIPTRASKTKELIEIKKVKTSTTASE
jgi:hypothetical protein